MKKKFFYLGFLLAFVFVLAGCGKPAVQPITEENKNTSPVEEIKTVDEQKTPDQSVSVKNTAYSHVFFSSKEKDAAGKNCRAVYWVAIDSDSLGDPIARSVNLLLAGPTSKWEGKGYYSSIPSDVKLNSVKIDGDVAYVDLSKELSSITDDCAKTMARSQIVMTVRSAAKDFLNKDLSKIVVSIDGDVNVL